MYFPSSGQEQLGSAGNPSKQKLLDTGREIMTRAGVCVLITVDEKCRPDTRLMDPFPPEQDFTVWLGTNPQSNKVRQIEGNPNVDLFYMEKDSYGYVVLHGTAQIVDDPREKELRWKEGWEAFYPDRSTSYLLIRITPVSMEIVSYAHGITGDPVTWQAPTVLFDTK